MKGDKGKEKTRSTDYEGSKDDYQKIYDKEEFLMHTLGPLENYLTLLQSILVWEKPPHSIALFLVVHLLFWLATTLRVYYVIGVIGVIFVLTDMWKNHIWPEIRVPPSPGEDTEGWTPVHPRLLSVPEICQVVAPWWQQIENFITYSIELRKNNHPKFFVMSMLYLSMIGVTGLYIKGITLAYFIVLFLLLWPCFLYHNGWNRVREVIDPVISNLESSFRVRRSRSKAVKRGKKKRGGEVSTLPSATDSDSDDLDQFVPESVTQNTPDSEDDEGDTLGLLTPPSIPSRTPSREPSDTEEGNSSGDVVSLSPSLHTMPSYNDTLDASLKPDLLGENSAIDLESALGDTTNSSHGNSASSSPTPEMAGELEEAITFVTSHFSQSDTPKKKKVPTATLR